MLGAGWQFCAENVVLRLGQQQMTALGLSRVRLMAAQRVAVSSGEGRLPRRPAMHGQLQEITQQILEWVGFGALVTAGQGDHAGQISRRGGCHARDGCGGTNLGYPFMVSQRRLSSLAFSRFVKTTAGAPGQQASGSECQS